jgi:hypothetical protein
MLKSRKWFIVLVAVLLISVMFTVECFACHLFTIGFWGNKNGERTIATIPNVWNQLSYFNLKDGEGNDFDPANFTQFKEWLRGANASNIKYMLSAQLAGALLNYLNFFVAEPWTVMVSVDTRISPSGVIRVQDLIGIANGLLNTLDADADKEILAMYSNALDMFNNYQNVILP